MRVGLVVVVGGLVGLAGCAGGTLGGLSGTGASQAAASAGAKLAGVVHGGQQPIAGAHVYLLAANTTGYGGNGIAPSSSNASLSLLTSGTVDTSGGATSGDYYVTTDSGGNFSITGDYTCAAGQQVYLYVLGGNPGIQSGVNASSGLMAALGNCPGTTGSTGNTFPSSLYIVVNEVSTVAAAYAFAGFATDAAHVGSSGTTLAQTGIANAFANAANLETLSTGAALATTPAGNGTVPQAVINTLADILASCVNSNGAVTGPTNATACYTLFTNALAGGTTGAQPADTATAAINIAHNPGTNVASLYALAGGTPPFAPALSATPNDWTICIGFSNTASVDEGNLAIDASGNVWIPNLGGNSITKLSSTGALLSGAGGFTGGGIYAPNDIAIDSSSDAWIASAPGPVVELSPSGSVLSGASGYSGPIGSSTYGIAVDGSDNVWFTATNSGVNSVLELSNSGALISSASGYTGGGLNDPRGIAFDTSGNAWVTNIFGASVTELSPSGSFLSGSNGFQNAGLQSSWSIAIDNTGSAWITNYGKADVVELSSAGSALSGTNGYSGGGVGYSYQIAIDGAGNAWVANEFSPSPPYLSSITELSNTGSIISGSHGYTGEFLSSPHGIAIDGSGNVWSTAGGGWTDELVGAAAPVVTPLSAGVKNKMLGTRP